MGQLVLEGMGRCLHTNFNAKFRCDTLKVRPRGLSETRGATTLVLGLSCFVVVGGDGGAAGHDQKSEAGGAVGGREYLRLCLPI